MYFTTGFSQERIVDLCAMIHGDTMGDRRPWPPILGLFKSVTVALTYMRRNRVQAELAETYGVSQSTISRAVTSITPLLGKVLEQYVPTADELDGRTHYIVDGTLLPCWSWASHPELYSGKHKTTGMNVQVACTLGGGLAWISDAIDGSRHDTYCLSESGVLLTLDPGNWIGDKGEVPRAFWTVHPLGWAIWKGEFLAQTEEELLAGIQGRSREDGDRDVAPDCQSSEGARYQRRYPR